jgi:hypothetical protein
MRTYQKVGRKRGQTEDLPGYPEYTEDEDIYRNAKEEDEIDPENIHRKKKTSFQEDSVTEEEDESGTDLDIPGAELDDDLEELGSEDEENNYYSLSDDHADDLEDLI